MSEAVQNSTPQDRRNQVRTLYLLLINNLTSLGDILLRWNNTHTKKQQQKTKKRNCIQFWHRDTYVV